LPYCALIDQNNTARLLAAILCAHWSQ